MSNCVADVGVQMPKILNTDPFREFLHSAFCLNSIQSRTATWCCGAGRQKGKLSA